jgi:hypothetical protein
MGQLNPKDESDAYAQNVAEGFMTIAEVTALTTGGDFERNHAQRAKEHRMRVEAGLEPAVLGVTTRGQVNEGSAAPTDPAGTPKKKIPAKIPAEDDSQDTEAAA